MTATAPRTSFRNPKGQTVSLDGLLADGKPLVLAFFKTSCPTCKLTWPYLQKLHAAYGESGVRVAGVSQNEPTAARAFYRSYGDATFDLLVDPEPAYDASNAFDVETVPHIVLIHPDGTIGRSFYGWQRTQMEALSAQIAAEGHLPEVPIIAADDPVPLSKPG